MPSPDAIVLPKVSTVEIRLDPAQIFINSLMLLIEGEELSEQWIPYPARLPETMLLTIEGEQ